MNVVCGGGGVENEVGFSTDDNGIVGDRDTTKAQKWWLRS